MLQGLPFLLEEGVTVEVGLEEVDKVACTRRVRRRGGVMERIDGIQNAHMEKYAI
jgi:hypothetical protein